MLLSREQIQDLTGKRQKKAQHQALTAMGIRHWVRPDGWPMVHESALTETPDHKTEGPRLDQILSRPT